MIVNTQQLIILASVKIAIHGMRTLYLLFSFLSFRFQFHPLVNFLHHLHSPFYRLSLALIFLWDKWSHGPLYFAVVRPRHTNLMSWDWFNTWFSSTSFQILGTKESDKIWGISLVGMVIVLAILLVISLVVLAYFVYRNHVLSSTNQTSLQSDTKSRNDSKDMYDNPDKDFEEVENDEATYNGLDRSGEKGNDDHEYYHLKEVQKDVADNYEEVEDDEARYTALDKSGEKANDDHEYCHLKEVQKDVAVDYVEVEDD